MKHLPTLLFLFATGIAFAQTPPPAPRIAPRTPPTRSSALTGPGATVVSNANAACGTSPHCAVLSWLWSQGTGDAATGFNIKRGTVSGGPYVTVSSVGPTITSYTDLSVTGNVLVEGTTYYWVITAFNATGESAPSNQATGTIPAVPPPPPTSLTVSVF
jgi:cellulose 1,4-beta-cellobiosidase